MKTRTFGVMIVIAWMWAATGTAVACNGPMVNNIKRTRQMLADADLILRVTAVAYSEGSAPGRGSSWGKVRFSVEEVVKGRYSDREIILPGTLMPNDEWNLDDPPYINPRSSADSRCYTHFYRTAGQFLLMLKRKGNGYTTEWMPLSPVNEQLRSGRDPWLLWVRDEVKR